MAVIFGSACHNEMRTYNTGAAGDQLQVQDNDYSGEVKFQKGYVHSKGWEILRAKDPNIANTLANAMTIAVKNINIGYSQNDRYGVVKKGVNTKVKVNSDCSSLVRACCKYAGFDPGDFNTSSERMALLGTGRFDLIVFSDLSQLCTGDILVTKSKGHTVIVTSGKSRTGILSSYKVANPVLKKGSKGDEVKTLQTNLNDLAGQGLDVDGSFGNKTYKAVMNVQTFCGLTIDGIYGPQTQKTLKAVAKSKGL